MNQELTESVQQSIRPGEMVDTYYAGETNQEKQAYPCIVNNRFLQQFTSLGAGTSQFVISPNQGVSDIVLSFRTATAGWPATTNICLPTGWGYGLINRVSVRYGSSAQYFFTGQQILAQNLLDAETEDKKTQILSLGGLGVSAANVVGAYAYCYLKLPHNSVRADGKPLPLPSDLLVQPIVVTVELNNPASVCAPFAGGALPAGIPTALSAAYMQVKQEIMSDSSDLLARRVDMNTHAYTLPLMYFPQQEVQIRCAGGAGQAQSVNLTGFRAGEVKSILLWLTRDADGTAGNPNYWRQMSAVQLTYNGEVFYRADDTVNALWSLANDTKSASASLFVSDGTALVQQTTNWLEIPFAQTCVAYDREYKLVHGKPILNAVVNLQFTLPTAENYTLHAVYLYNASLLMSRGSAEYIF